MLSDAHRMRFHLHLHMTCVNKPECIKSLDLCQQARMQQV